MNKYLILAISIFIGLFSQESIAQSEATVTGTVMDESTGQPLEYATVSFFSKQENKIITGGITGLDGTFSIPVQPGTYDVRVEFISFKTVTIPDKKITGSENLGSITLALDMQSLGEVQIVAERTTVELKLDKRIYNVGQDLTVRGGTVSDVLDNVPSVSVDVEGNVALRGNQNVRILINGRPSGLVGLNSTDALRQLPAEAIERVEVITSPSSRYDAEGTGGILNIILRRSKLQGFNGAITLNAGTPTTYGASGNINYRTGDFNFFNTSSYNYRENPGNGLSETEYFNGSNPSTFLNEYRRNDRINNGLTFNTGVEWYINETATLTTSVVLRNGDNESESRNSIFELDQNGTVINELLRLNPEREDDETFQYSVNFDKQFGDNSQHRLTLDFQYENSGEDEFAIITQDGDDSERVQTLENQDRVLLQGDYVLPIGENSQFEAGYRGNFNVQDTDYTLEFNENGEYVIDTDLSNNLIYTEHVNAFYTQFGSKIKDKFSYLLGLRLEETRLTIDQVTSGDYEKKNYLGLFPTVNLSYAFTEDQSITFGYNRRISRPRSRFINPFPSRTSATNVFQGNPDLNPSFSDAVDLGYLNQFGKLTLNSSIYYQRATDVFTFISEDTGETAIVGGTPIPIIRRTPINLATNERTGFEFTLTYRPTDKWNLNGNFNLFNSKNRGEFNGTSFDNDNTTWFARLNNKYTLPGGIDWQTRLFYRGPSQDAQNKNQGIASVDLAFSKDLFNDNASIAVNVSDLFNSRKRISETTTASFFSYNENQWRQRSFNIAFTYRFNQQKMQQNRNRRNMENGNGQGGEGGGEFDEMGFD